jgi:hypothetical protein
MINLGGSTKLCREAEVKRRGKVITSLFEAAALMLPAIALAAPKSAGSIQDFTEPRPSADIVVEARSRAAVRSFVAKVAKPEPGRQLARWHQPLCIAFRGIAPEYELAMAARIREVATSVRVKVLTKPCSTNLAIVLSRHVPAIVKAMLAEWPYRFGDLGDDQFVRARRANALLAPRAIRWFPGVVAVGEDGMPFVAGGLRINHSSIASRIRATTREEMVQSTILIDQDLLAGITLNQLDDYLTFVALATPDMMADYTGMDSILSILSAPVAENAPKKLTELDRDYLSALYATAADQTAAAQISDIRSRLMRPRALRQQGR